MPARSYVRYRARTTTTVETITTTTAAAATTTTSSTGHRHHHHAPPAFSALSSFPSFLSYELISLFFCAFFVSSSLKTPLLVLSLSLDAPFLLPPSPGSPASVSSTRPSLPRASSFRSSRASLVPSALLSSAANRPPELARSIPDPSHRRTPRSRFTLSASLRAIRIEARQGGYGSSAGRRGRPVTKAMKDVYGHLRTREDESLGNRLLHARPH